MTAFSKAFEDVQQLVNTFNSSYSHYMSPGYSEAEARQDFIDNFFIALAWVCGTKNKPILSAFAGVR
jgi:hypothetical protein